MLSLRSLLVLLLLVLTPSFVSGFSVGSSSTCTTSIKVSSIATKTNNNRQQPQQQQQQQPWHLYSTSVKKQQQEEEDDDPCWEEIFDDDCAMRNVYASAFVAANWIKKMPCAAGIPDCDMPADLKLPETRTEAGIDHIDVMAALGLKRAAPVNAKKNEE